MQVDNPAWLQVDNPAWLQVEEDIQAEAHY